MASFSIPKMVEQDVPKSYFNQSCARRTTAVPGVLIPIYHKYVIPGDEFDIGKVSAKIRTNPFVVPLMGSFRVQMDWFFEPLTNLYGFMDNNDTLSTAQILAQDLHTFSLYSAGLSNSKNLENPEPADALPWFAADYITSYRSNYYGIGHVAPGSLWNYLGFPADFDCSMQTKLGVNNPTTGSPLSSSKVRADAFFAYFDIYRTYYTNKQFKQGAIFSGDYSYNTDIQTDGGVYQKSALTFIDQSVFDEMFKELRMIPTGSRNYSDATTYGKTYTNLYSFIKSYAPMIRGTISATDISPTSGSSDTDNDFGYKNTWTPPFSGLAVATYRPDVYSAVMLPAESTLTATVGSVALGSGRTGFTIDTLRVASHYQKLLDLYDASGGQFSHWIKMQFDVDISNNTDRPVLLNTSHQYITVDDVTALSATNKNSDGTGVSVDVGEQFGQINTGAGFQGIKFRSRYHGVLMCIVSIVPEVDYSGNFEQNMFDTAFADLYTPAMAQLGYEGMTVGDFFAGKPLLSSITFEQGNNLLLSAVRQIVYGRPKYLSDKSYLPNFDVICGRNVHWWRYMSDVSRVYAGMSIGQPYDGWTLQRRYYTEQLYKEEQDLGSGAGNNKTNIVTTSFSMSPYINPKDWQYFFSYQDPSAQNWFLQFAFDITVRRPIPKYVQGRIV